MPFPRSITVWVITSVICFSELSFAQQRGAHEQTLLDSANRERASRGLRPLRWDTLLARVARQHALLMAQQNSLSHQLHGELDLRSRAARAGSRFSALAENIAEGPSVTGIHAQWMQSAPHRANLLDANLNSLGIAVVARGNVLFAVEDFAETLANLTFEEQEKQVDALLQARGLSLLFNTEDARQTCALEQGHSAKRRPAAVVRYETTDVSRLPRELEQKIQNGQYHSAAVGACPAGGLSDFEAYRLAVLLY